MNQRIYRRALESQSACNASGLLNDLSKTILPAIWEEAQQLGGGTEYVNHHPVIFLFLHQLSFLAGSENFSDKHSARWDECYKICTEKSQAPVEVA